GSDTIALGLTAPAGGAAGAEDDYLWVNDTLTAYMRSEQAVSPANLLVKRGPAPLLLSAARMPTAWGDTLVYAAVYAPSALATLLSDILDRDALLPPLASGLSNREVLNLEVTGPEGTLAF